MLETLSVTDSDDLHCLLLLVFHGKCFAWQSIRTPSPALSALGKVSVHYACSVGLKSRLLATNAECHIY